MNDIVSTRVEMEPLTGNIAAIVLDLKLPEGFAARLWDFTIFDRVEQDSRLGINLYKYSSPIGEGVTAWTGDQQVLRDGDVISRFIRNQDFVTSGSFSAVGKFVDHLWDQDIRVVAPLQIGGFAQVAQQLGFELRFKRVRASRTELAAILFWQNRGVKRA